MASRLGVVFVAVYYDIGTVDGGRASEELDSALDADALVRWAEERCPEGKRLGVIYANDIGSANIWHESGGIVEHVRASVFG